MDGAMSNAVGDDEQGWLGGATQSLQAAMSTVAPLIAAALYATVSHAAPYWLGAAIMMRLLLIGPVMVACLAAIVLLAESNAMLIAGVVLIVVMPFGGVGTLGLLFQLRVDNRVPMLVLTLRSVLWGAAVIVIHAKHGGLVAFAIAAWSGARVDVPLSDESGGTH